MRHAPRSLLVSLAVIAAVTGVLMAPAAGAGTAIGSLDPRVGTNGAVAIPNRDGSIGAGADLHALDDGRFLLLVPGDPAVVHRSTAQGEPDVTFGGDGSVTVGVSGRFDALTVDGSGRLLLAGTQGSGGGEDVTVVRLRPGGALDGTFGDGGVARVSRPSVAERGCGIATVPSGGMVIAAAGLDPRDPDDPADDRTLASFIKLGDRGRVHDDFGTNGVVRLPQPAARCNVFPQPNGTIVFGGPPQGPSWLGRRCAVGRLLADGTPDATFHGDGVRGIVASTGTASRCATTVTSEGTIVVALRTGRGTRTSYDVELVRIRAGGSLDTSFGGDGRVRIDLFGSDDAPVALLADDRGVVVASTSAGLGRGHDVGLVRVADDGRVARSFGIEGRIGTDLRRTLGGAAGEDRAIDAVWHGDGLLVLGLGPRPTRTRVILRYGAHELDRRPPVSRVTRPRAGATYGQLGVRAIRGTADDVLSGVRRVEVALRRTLRDGTCGWLGTRGGFISGRCDEPRWLRADGRHSWIHRLPRLLEEVGPRVSSYRAYARAIDGAGNVETRLQASRNANTFRVKN